MSPPDIDLDFDERRRGEVMRYTVDKWGEENVAQVITFGTIKTKAAIKDAARVLHGQPGFAIADRISKALPPPIMAKDIPLSGIFNPSHERYAEATEVRTLAETDPEVGRIMGTARGLEGLVRNAGVHACAVILSAEPLLDVIPLWKRDDGSVITGWDYPSCEEIGLLKMDFLGLRTLTVVGDTVDSVRNNYGVEIDTATLALDDKKTYELLSRGDTLGVFQLDGGGMRTLLKAMEPSHFGDIAAALALYRPGPMAANAHMDYAERSNGRQKLTPIHPELEEALEPILGETYHLLVYQEQVMAIAQRLAGYSLGQADLLRRAMGKKKKEIIEKEYEGFKAGMLAKGFSAESCQTLWDVMLPFSGYAFNKSHTAGYGLVSYWTAFLKANYPVDFMAAQLTSIGDNKDKSAVYLAECRRLGIKVLPPDVNDSDLWFRAVDGDIRFGLGAVRNVGANVVESIIKTRRDKGRFTSFTDFLEKVDLLCCNKRLIESLIKAGAFDSFGQPRRALLMVHEEAVDGITGLKRQEAMGQFDLFVMDDQPAASDVSPLAHLKITGDEWPRKQMLGYEREMLGLYVSAHPLDGTERILRKHAPTADRRPHRRGAEGGRDRPRRDDLLGRPAGEQEGRALGDRHDRGSRRLDGGAVLPEVVLGDVRGPRRRLGRRGEGPGQLARRADVGLRLRGGGARHRRRPGRARPAARAQGRCVEARPRHGRRAQVGADRARGRHPAHAGALLPQPRDAAVDRRLLGVGHLGVAG